MAATPVFTAALPSVPTLTPSASTPQPSIASAAVTFLARPGNNQELSIQSINGQPVLLVANQPVVPVAFTTYLWQLSDRIVFWTVKAPEVNPTFASQGSITFPLTGPPSTLASPPAVTVTSLTSGAVSSQPASPTTTTSGATSSHSASPTTTTTIGNGTLPSTDNGSDGISGGAVAGVAIGCLIAGALIAGFILWFCCGKRKSKRTRDSEANTLALMPQEKAPSARIVPLENISHASPPPGNSLPQPLEDDAISSGISKISSLIKNHVQSYYHINRVDTTLIDFDDIQALGHDLPVSVGTLSTLIVNPGTRHIALRFCMARVVISRMQPHKEPSKSFLPLNISRGYQEIVSVNTGSTSHLTLMARWRAMTAELLQSTYIDNSFASTDGRNPSMQAAVGDLENILLPFADSRMNSVQRKQNLEEILKRSAQFALTLFSQPSTWKFDWKDDGAQSNGLCVFPALVQITNEAGKPVRPPRSFNEAVVRRLDE